MITVKVCVLGQRVLRDSETQNISVIDIIEEISPEGFPFFIQNLDFLIIWEKDSADKDEYSCEIKIALNEKALLSKNIQLGFKGRFRNRTIVNLKAFVIPEPGTLSFVALLDNGVKAEYVFDVKSKEATVSIKEDKDIEKDK